MLHICRTLLITLAAAPAFAQSPPAAVAAQYIPKLERNLKEAIVRFWYPRSLDTKNGGYTIAADAKGVFDPAASKGIVTQSRMLWFFSRLAREGYEPKQNLAAAEHGFRFLRDKMWDKKNGGFYWEMDAAGGQIIRPKKHMYGESFALYALSEYYLASKNKAALDLANELFRLMEAHAYDKQYGGYLEFFNEDWTPVPAGEQSYMGPSEFKLMNTHLHLLESVTAYYRASHSAIARERLLELITIESNTVVRKGLGACTDKYDRTWKPRLEANYARVSYGHDLENIWLLEDAAKAAGISGAPLHDMYRALFDYSMKYGWDADKGGFYESGAFNQPADQQNKTWWVEAEAAVSALYMYRISGERKYLDIFSKTYDFIDRYQTDWQAGEWFPTVSPDGKQTGAKAQIWKAAYHQGRAMLECMAILREIR